MKENVIKSQDFEKYSLELDARGFLRIKHRSNILFDLDDAIKQEADIIEFCQNKPMPFLVDVRVQNWNAPKEVRDFHSTSKGILKMKKCEAILVNNLGIKILANFYSKFNKPPNPAKVFTEELKAIEWVNQFIQKN
jgi:hypothetical protein